MKEGRFRFNIRKKVFMMRREALEQVAQANVDALSLEVFKVRLDRALPSLI